MEAMEIVVKENEDAEVVIWCEGRPQLGTCDWVTHIKEKESGAYFLGHYDMTLEDAISDAKGRNL